MSFHLSRYCQFFQIFSVRTALICSKWTNECKRLPYDGHCKSFFDVIGATFLELFNFRWNAAIEIQTKSTSSLTDGLFIHIQKFNSLIDKLYTVRMLPSQHILKCCFPDGKKLLEVDCEKLQRNLISNQLLMSNWCATKLAWLEHNSLYRNSSNSYTTNRQHSVDKSSLSGKNE